MPACDKQIGQRAGDNEAMSVLSEPAVAHFGKAEDPLDDTDRMLDFGAHLRFGPVFRALALVHDTAMAIAAVDEVLRARCVLADHRPLAAIGLVAPHAGFVPVQQIGQHLTVGNIGRCRHHRVDQLAAAVDPEMPLHPEVSWEIFRILIQWLRVRFGKPNTQVCHQMFASTGTMSSCFRSPSSPYALDQRLPYTSAPPASWHVR